MKLSIAAETLDRLLQSMYRLPHRPVLHLHDEESCKQFVSLVESCINAEFKQVESSNPTGSPQGFSADEVCAIEKAITMVKTTLDILWLPDYASAIIVHSANHQLPGTVTITIIGLDSHSFFMHHDDADGYLHESDALDYKILMAGTTGEEKVQAFWARFKRTLNRAQTRDGDKRSAAGGKQGHQFTPALIHAVATQSINCPCEENQECSCEEVVPKGGFTDVGRHTGGSPRNTSYALVKFALEWSLVQGGRVDKVLFRKVFLLVHMRILSDRVHRVHKRKNAKAEKAWKARADLDVAFRILEVISIDGHLHEKGICIKFFFERAQSLRERMDSIVEKLGKTEAERFVLPDVNSILEDTDAFRSPTLHIPPDLIMALTSRDYEDRINRNVGPNTLFHKRTHFDLTGLLEWLKSSDFQGKRDQTTVLLRLRTVEDVFWNRAKEGLDKESLTSADVGSLLSVVNEYRTLFHLFETGLEKGDLMMSELRSRELLLVWISYCLTFAAAKSAYSDLMSTVGVALRYEDLEHLVLSDRESWVVAIEVASFLRHHFISEQSELFSLRAPDATFSFAEKFSRNDTAIMRIWRAEQNDAQCRVDAHWREVQKKKAEAIRLRSEIATLESKLRRARSDLEGAERSAQIHGTASSRSYLRQCRAEVRTLQGNIRATKNSLEVTLQAPQAVCQPLPRGESSSLRWLYFLYMPEIYRVLSTLSFTGQQMLVPRPWNAQLDGPDGTQLINVSSPLLATTGDCLTSFYGTNQSYAFHSPQERRSGVRGHVGLVSATSIAMVRPKTIGPSSVDEIFSKEDGVWYPDCVPYKMEWRGGTLSWDSCNNCAFDPFKVPREWAVSFFTENLEWKSLQWAMRLDENSNAAYERGNRALACQETRPEWLSKTEFLTFCKMRGFPSIQLRNVAIAVLDRSLPFQLAPVQVLLKQTIFHIGRLHTDRKGKLSLGWKEDLTNGELLDTTKAILKNLIEEIKDSPSSYSSALVVCDIAGFMSDWDSDFKTISRRLAESACRWAEAYGQQAESAEKASDSINFRVHQRLRLCLSLLCLTQGPMSDDDVHLTVKCIAVGKNVCVDEEVKSSLRTQLSRIETRCASLIARRIATILKVVKNDSSLLSDAIRAVITVVPDSLSWAQRGPSSSSFEANGSDGCSYVINVLTGVILVNGHPPSSLPSEILEHELYKRSFGGRNFEVVCKNEVYETCRMIGGFVFRFALHHHGQLCITERSHTEGEWFELLDGVKTALWAAQLPVRLQEMHSHWLSRDSNTITLRGIFVFDRDVSFIIRLVQPLTEKEGVVGNCHVVPNHLKRNGFREIMESSPSFPRLVLHDSDLLSIFAKFEERRFVHFIVDGSESSSSILNVSLPRYGITFSFREGWFHCVEISGFVLSKCQQLGGSLFGFEQYLVLEQNCKDFEKPLTCIVVPDGGILRARLEGSTIVKPAVACDANVTWHRYDVHPRFQTLQAGTVASRLYLVALYASTSFISADYDSSLTGFEKAIELVRGCWVARVLSVEERQGLLKASSACKGRHPTLSLLCSEVLQSSQSVSFLYTGTDAAELALSEWKCRPDEAEKYLNDLQCGLLNSRNRLTPIEELRLLGQYGRVPESQTVCAARSGEPPPVEKDVGERMEEALCQLWDASEPRPVAPHQREFPLRTGLVGALEKDIFAELRFSWNIHLKLTSRDEQHSAANINTRSANLLRRIFLSRKMLEDYIIDALNDGMDNAIWMDNAIPNSLDLKRLSRLHPRAIASDLLRATLQRDFIKTFNVSLRDEEQEKLHMFILEWLRLCVLEDKVERLTKLSEENDHLGLQSELRIVRNWNPSEHPAWLVFEVEHRVQIWPEQAMVARHLINNSGDIVQLNMGMGKTRVITPLLVLHWAFHCDDDDSIPRINILPSLLSEACDFFHQRLTASVFHLKLAMLPFSRDVELDGRSVLGMRSLVSWCREHSGFVIVAPEHRLSLELKIKELELGQRNNLAKEVRSFLEESRWMDILDESDELLHHRFQLIYAFGSVQELPGGPHRWRAAQALLCIINGNRQVDEWIRRNKDFAKRTNDAISEEFCAIQINSRPSKGYLISQFYHIVADALLTSPPHELEWIQGHTQKESIRTALIDELAPSEALKGLGDDEYSDVLALRGLLVGGILIHCLQKRHHVDFGVARPGKKKLSVPFRGADTPSLRSEFSHPDCAIVFTVLAYYEDGLDEEQVASSFRILFTLGRNVQRVIYSQWFSLSRGHIDDPSVLSSLDRVEKIDMSNRAQFKLLVTFYRLNMRVINFWLNSSVFPDEMQYYPQRLSATSWNLAENSAGQTVGFSGTNDNHRLLPRQVKQYFADPDSSDPILQSLTATNGRMLEIILNRTIKCVHLSGCKHVDKIMELLQSDPALEGAQAIIDAGALLAGQSNVKLARKIAATLQCNGIPKFKGVLFFDNSSPDGQWMALEPSGRILPKNQSPVRDSDAFAIFDEPRCRGADLKLKKTATALITIGPRMCKDKFMQAAGRMRALDRGQSLVITGTDFLFQEIRETANSKQVTPLIVLEWALHNTVKATTQGLIPWANQGLFFCTSQGAPELSLEDEKLSLKDYYGGSFHEVSIRDAVVNARKYHNSRIGRAASRIDQKARALMSQIVQQANRYGENTAHAMCGMDEECERELELDREIEEEKEVEIPRMVPLKETDWDKSIVLEATALEDLSEYVEFIALVDYVADQLQPHGLSLFAWSPEVFGTSNFFRTVTSQSGAPLPSSNYYLSIVDVFLAFPDNKILLISDREADELIKLFWTQSATGKDVKVVLTHLSLLRSSLDKQIPDLNPNLMVLGKKCTGSRIKRWGQREWWDQREDQIATMQLFAGEVDYRTNSRFEALKKILRGPEVVLGPVVADPEHIVDARGNSHFFSHSEIEKACRELAREAQQMIRNEENADSSLPNL